MPLHPTWLDITIRLALTVGASAIIGFNRESRGHSAGLRTTILVGVAASVAMIQANLLLTLDGRTPDSFGTADLMRLPLGILTGVGFIGGGAILRRGDLVTGVTTAATMWVTTVIGLCFGGGQIWLGVAAAGISVGTLSALKRLDAVIVRDRRARLVIRAPHAPVPPDAATIAGRLPYHVRFMRQTPAVDPAWQRATYEVRWRQRESGGPPADLLDHVAATFSIDSFEMLSEK